ncbi:MAG: excinuclease ABC subunit UvrA [Candidatus Gracilibacteria bacterium]|nr:excinuclease ABC subunit UvrA [Candidatus Gracilibacteria bacterium]
MSKFLEVIGAKTHNLKNINVSIPKNKMTVITGVSGSGKSSLAFNTIYNVGQQKYLESLSSYARMFIGGMSEEADVSEINGLSPTISIDQKTTSKNPRSTVGTITEIYDYYKLLFLNVGERKCVKCGTIVKKDTIESIITYINEFEDAKKFLIKAPIKGAFANFEEIKKEVLDLGFIRFSIGSDIYTINDTVELNNIDNLSIVVDRLVKKDFTEDSSNDVKRLKDSINLAYKIGKGQLIIDSIDTEKGFSQIFVCSNCGHIPSELNISSFSFNSHHGACPECHGLGVKKVFLEDRVINFNLTLLEGAVIAPGFGGEYFFALLKELSKKTKIDINTNYSLLSKKDKDIILYGTGDIQYKVTYINEYGVQNTYNTRFEGVINALTRRYYDGGSEKGHYDDFVVDMDCHVCNGFRLNEESLSTFVGGLNIGQVSDFSVNKAIDFLKSLKMSRSEEHLTKKVMKNAVERLEFLSGVGLDYMTISRRAGTLSGGEAQRIRLATQLGTRLEGIIYVLDEPSIGLHPRDNDMLIANLKKLRDIGNTLIVVEHDEDIMRECDHIIDIGPGAGIHGGQVMATGNINDIINNPDSVTGPYLSHKRDVIVKRGFRPSFSDLKKNKKILEIVGASQHNLKNVDVSVPLSNFVVVTGVSGSGKSSLVNDILANYLANELNRAKRDVGAFKEIRGLENLDKTVIIDQSPIGKTPRSNPATYTQVFTPIRDVFSMTQEAQIRGFGPGRFSFNTKDGRCEACDGDGVKKIEMHFLPPVYVECETCYGKRYNSETLTIKYKGKTISDVLDMTVEEAKDFFSSHPKITKILDVLDDVGLGYIKLGQSSTTLSGGESQRVKLSTELSKRSTSKTFYILDEPTTGLHFQDVDKLLNILHSLVDKGNTVMVIEHNMDVIMNADHIIDIGPVGGDKGGYLIAEGTVDDIANVSNSFTGEAIVKYRKKILENK